MRRNNIVLFLKGLIVFHKMKQVAMVVTATLLVATTLSGCVGNPIRNEDVGRVAGAAIGVGIGSLIGGGNGRVAAMIIGGIAGSVIGGHVGRNLDQSDHERAARLARRGFEDPLTHRYSDNWVTQRGHRIGSAVIVGPQFQMYGTICRSFTQETIVFVDGRPDQWIQEGVACYDRSRGVWVIQ